MQKSNLILVAVATAVALLAAEILVRFLPPDLTVIRDLVTYVDEPIGYRLKPNVQIEFDGLFATLPKAVTWATNQQRMRSAEEYHPDPQKRLIATFGDSETFGWSVAAADTYQAYLEQLSPELQVLNFGVPGYNTTNIAYAMSELLPQFQPNAVIYLFNKNDFDLPVYISDSEFSSHLLGRIRWVWQITVAKDERKRIRNSVERARVAATDLASMVQLTNARGATFVLAFMRWSDWQRLQTELAPDHPLLHAIAAGRARVVNAELSTADKTKLDDHLSPAAYRALAEQLCNLPLLCGKSEQLAGSR